MVEVQQALFGYDHGHRLLSASRQLSATALRAILPLTDPPDLNPKGPNVIGFPIPGEELFVLGRTWPAPELPRPGCVWTHLLIVAISDLPGISSVSALKYLWKRPDQRSDKSSFERSLVLEPSRNGQVATPFVALKKLLAALYGHPEKSIWFQYPMEDSDDLSLAVWEQQWPRLRADFRFCAGVKSPRFVGDMLFDLHLSPNQWRGADEAFLLVEPSDRTSDDEVHSETWVDLLSEDVQWGNSAFRSFLWEHGQQVSRGRAAMSSLADIYLLLQSPRLSPRETVRSLAFSQKHELNSLKREVFVEERFGELDDTELLMALVDVESDSFAAEDLRLSGMVRSWAMNAEPIRLLKVLQHSSRGTRTEMKETVLAGVKDVVSQKLEFLANVTDDRGLRILFRRFPDLVVQESVWRSPALQRRLWRAISSLKLSRKIREEFLVLAFHYGLRNIVADLTREWGPKEWQAALATAAQRGIDLSEAWRAVVEENLETILRTEPKPEILELLATSINPLSQKVLRLGSKPWREFAERVESLKGDRQIHFAAFLFCIGTRSMADDGRILVTQSFPILHDALAKPRVPESAWSLLDRFLPKLREDEAWDRCERLRLSLLRTVDRRGWSEDVIVSAARDEKTLAAISETARRERTTRRVFRKLTDNVVARNFPRELRQFLEELLG
jgi:hypothetical protein